MNCIWCSSAFAGGHFFFHVVKLVNNLDMQKDLKEIERLLKTDPTDMELLSQKQEKLKTAIQATKESWMS